MLRLIKYLESKFKPGMSWKNHGQRWEIDHIPPLCSFDLTRKKEALKAVHCTNLQPLWIGEHKRKSAKELASKMFM